MIVEPTERAIAGGPDVTPAHDYRSALVEILSGDLDFRGQRDNHAFHNFHSFPAKFPPQLPRTFIERLTSIGDVILDPMVGSGTTVLEAFISGRRAIGFDIDPLALTISKAKTVRYNVAAVSRLGNRIITQARGRVRNARMRIEESLDDRWDAATREFVNQWFSRDAQVELQALMDEIECIDDLVLRDFFDVVFSSIIITKSGGVSLALDLGHTRPHLAKKVVRTSDGSFIKNETTADSASCKPALVKTLRSPIEEFEKRFRHNLGGMLEIRDNAIFAPKIEFGRAQTLPLDNSSVDLVVTSPPYASNAIDYMRAHKFSLVWMGHQVEVLGQKRKGYIGNEIVKGKELAEVPPETAAVVSQVAERDRKRALVLHAYYSDMKQVLSEIFRVLRPNKAAIVVVGSSTFRGIDTRTGYCLAEIGHEVGFDIAKIAERRLERDRRMLPAGSNPDLASQIQQRMHIEYVIGFHKPLASFEESQIANLPTS